MFLALGFGQPRQAHAEQIIPFVYTTSTAEDIVRAYAIHYGVSGDALWKTIRCEDPTLDPGAVGDHGLARGVAQIRSDYWPNITNAQAFDPLFSIDFMARQFTKGNASYWSCYRSLKA
jgi:hypothetical protein